jgi:hypothetical protein
VTHPTLAGRGVLQKPEPSEVDLDLLCGVRDYVDFVVER